MATLSSTRGRLWRYNYKILVGTGYWVIVLPVAASQVVTLWTMALAGEFNQTTATAIAELMTPILGAFLVAHSMAPEYRSGVGAVLASKPLSLHRVLTMRVGLAMLAALALTFATLGVCSVGVKAVDLWPPLLACLPSLWALSMLALTFATVFRNALGGFAVAACVWALDLALGYSVNPFLSLQGLHAHLESDPLATLWPYSKAALLVAGVLLLWLHGKLIHRIHRSADRTDVLKVVASCVVVLVIYCVSGAGAMVSYAYTHRGNLATPDLTWLRRQIGTYGPVPVTRFFGPAFATYVAPTPETNGTPDASLRVKQLEQALLRWPGSIWADSIAFALAGDRETLDPVASAQDYFAVADRHGRSPFAPKALARIIRIEAQAVPEATRLRAARQIIASYPRSPEVENAAELLEHHYGKDVSADEILKTRLAAAEVAPAHLRPGWLLGAADAQRTLGKTAEAIALARQARDEARKLSSQAQPGAPLQIELAPHLARIDGTSRAADELLKQMGATP